MSATLDLYKLASKQMGWPTPYAASVALNYSRESVYRWANKGGTMDDDTVLLLCEMTGEDPEYWAPLIHAERSKSPAAKKLWKSIADKATRAAAVVLAVLVLYSPAPAPAVENPLQINEFPKLYIMLNGWRIWLRWLLRLTLITLIGLGYSAQPARADNWTQRDTAWQAAYLTVLAADLAQTHRIVSNGDRESNPILGERPTHGAVTVAILMAGLGHTLIARDLPPPWRRAWQVLWIGIEANAVHNNLAAGISLTF